MPRVASPAKRQPDWCPLHDPLSDCGTKQIDIPVDGFPPRQDIELDLRVAFGHFETSRSPRQLAADRKGLDGLKNRVTSHTKSRSNQQLQDRKSTRLNSSHLGI